MIKELQRIEKKLIHYVGKAISDYNLIQTGDRVLVCLSGGKDSYTMLMVLRYLMRKSNFKFKIHSYTLDQSQPGWNDSKMREFLECNEIPYTIEKRDTYSVVKEKTPEGKTYCSLCSRLRRGNIYRFAEEHGYNKIALGHHRDDLIQSLLMSICYSGEIRSMPPKLLTDSKKHIVVRPLVYCQEQDIAQYAILKKFPIIPCNLCGSQANLTRQKVAKLIREMANENPKIPANMLNALSHVSPSQLMDRSLHSFKTLETYQKNAECSLLESV